MAFNLTTLLQSLGSGVNSYNQGTLQNLAQSQAQEQSALEQALAQAQLNNQTRGIDLREEDLRFRQGQATQAAGDRARQGEIALRGQHENEELQRIQQNSLAGLGDSLGIPGGGQQFARAGGSVSQLDDLIRALAAQQKATTSGSQQPTNAQRAGMVKDRMGVQRNDILSAAGNASGYEIGNKADLEALAAQGLGQETGGFLGFGKTPAPDSSGLEFLNKFNAIGSPANRQATNDSLPGLYPDRFPGQSGPAPVSTSTGTPKEITVSRIVGEIQGVLGGRIPTAEQWQTYFQKNPDDAAFSNEIMSAIGVSQ